MEHIIVKELEGGYVRLKAERGYRLFSLALDRFVSEAVVKEKDTTLFKAVAK